MITASLTEGTATVKPFIFEEKNNTHQQFVISESLSLTRYNNALVFKSLYLTLFNKLYPHVKTYYHTVFSDRNHNSK